MKDQSARPTSLVIECVESAPFAENSYILWRVGDAECAVVDPGLDPESILDLVAREDLRVGVILNTHGHADHIAGNAAIKSAWPDAPLLIGRRDAPKLSDPKLNLSAQYGLALVSPLADRLLDDKDIVAAAGFDWLVRELPGHSIGHVVFIARQHTPIIVLGGDVLMQGSVGRTDFPDGSFEVLNRGIQEVLFTLPDTTVVLPGHGPPTTTGEERRSNPFVGQG